MAKKLFVGNLPYTTTDEELREMFAAAGTVESAIIIVDKFSRRSKGFGFVEMSTDEEAQKAVEMLNEKEMGGRKMIVNEARPMQERPRNGGGFGGGRGGSSGGGRGGFGGGRGGFDRGGFDQAA